MKVLLSIKPKYADLILDGEKLFEFRKSIFKNPEVNKVVIYATKPVGKVVGEFDVGEVLSSKPKDLWRDTEQYAGVTKDFFEEYFIGRKVGFAISVKNPVRYVEPINLEDYLPGATPPQSYRYV